MNQLAYIVGTGVADITPPLEVGFLLSSVEQKWAPFQGVRRPLRAAAICLASADRRAVIVSLDLLGLADSAVGGMRRFKSDILDAAGINLPPEHLILTCTHAHSVPESIALTDLEETPAFRAWISELGQRIGQAIREAAATARPARMVGAAGSAPGLSLHRRILTTNGVVLSHPEPDPATIISRTGPRDESVKLLAFLDEGTRPVAMIVNATCHPVHEMCAPHVSPDYPGLLCDVLREQTGGAALFLNGAAGNINPTTVSAGPQATQRHGERLARLVLDLLSRAKPATDVSLDLASATIALPARASANGHPANVTSRIASLALGEFAIAFLPGEPFVETGLWLQERSPFAMTLVAGYSEAYIGYVPTDRAFAEGGYETGPGKWSRVMPGSEPELRRAAMECLEHLWQQRRKLQSFAH